MRLFLPVIQEDVLSRHSKPLVTTQERSMLVGWSMHLEHVALGGEQAQGSKGRALGR